MEARKIVMYLLMATAMATALGTLFVVPVLVGETAAHGKEEKKNPPEVSGNGVVIASSHAYNGSVKGSEKSDNTADDPESTEDSTIAGSEKFRLVWLPDDCGCTPIQPERESGTTKITYGFYHDKMESEADEENNIATAKIKFSRLNRIGYFSMGYDTGTGLMDYEGWEQNGVVKNARQYNTRVDLVLKFSNNPGSLFKSKSKIHKLIREIERLIKDHDGTGVTIDFRNTSNLEYETMHRFVSDLSKKMKTLGKGRYLNLFFAFNGGKKEAEFNTLSLNQVRDMMDDIDLLLVMVLPVNGKNDPLKTEDSFLALTRLIDRYGLENDDIEFKDKTIPVLWAGDEQNEEIFNQILLLGYGGVGLWPETSLSGEATEFISIAFKKHPGILQLDPIAELLLEYCPSCCKWICPHRVVWKAVTGTLMAALILYYILSFFFCELRAFTAAHLLYLVGSVLVFLLLAAGLILCVPAFEGHRSLAMGLLVICGALYILMDFIRRRREARFP